MTTSFYSTSDCPGALLTHRAGGGVLFPPLSQPNEGTDNRSTAAAYSPFHTGTGNRNPYDVIQVSVEEEPYNTTEQMSVEAECYNVCMQAHCLTTVCSTLWRFLHCISGNWWYVALVVVLWCPALSESLSASVTTQMRTSKCTCLIFGMSLYSILYRSWPWLETRKRVFDRSKFKVTCDISPTISGWLLVWHSFSAILIHCDINFRDNAVL